MKDPLYLKSIEFVNDYRCFKQGDTYNLFNITLLVGDQGCGKSTLLELLAKNDKKILKTNLTIEGQMGINTFYFDSEKMNPRIKDPMIYSNIDGTNKGIGFGNALATRFTSHGETLSTFTINALQKVENCVIFLDEPESGLSIRNQFKLARVIMAASDRNCQLIIATHCIPLIQSVSDVLSLEHKKWCFSKYFVSEQENEQNKNN